MHRWYLVREKFRVTFFHVAFLIIVTGLVTLPYIYIFICIFGRVCNILLYMHLSNKLLRGCFLSLSDYCGFPLTFLRSTFLAWTLHLKLNQNHYIRSYRIGDLEIWTGKMYIISNYLWKIYRCKQRIINIEEPTSSEFYPILLQIEVEMLNL